MCPRVGPRELTGYRLYQPFASVGVRRDCSSANTTSPCGGSLLSIMSESAEESDSGAHDVVVGIRNQLQVNNGVSDTLAVWLSRDDVVNTFPIRRPGTVECTRRSSLGDEEERVDEGRLVVTRRPPKRGSIAAVTDDPDVLPISPNYFTILLSYSYTGSSVSIY